MRHGPVIECIAACLAVGCLCAADQHVVLDDAQHDERALVQRIRQRIVDHRRNYWPGQ